MTKEKNMVQHIISVLLCIVMCVGFLTSCGSSGKNDNEVHSPSEETNDVSSSKQEVISEPEAKPEPVSGPEEKPEPIEVFLNISVGGNPGVPEFTIQTNLPDGTVLSLEMALDSIPLEGQSDYFKQLESTVKDGIVTTEPFSNEGKPLIGDYSFGVVMLPTEQPEQVLEIIGSNGENISGSLVIDLEGYRYIAASTKYHFSE